MHSNADVDESASGHAAVIPSYADLRARTDAPAGSTWGLFGERDERGMANLAGPGQIRDAARLVTRGVAFDLDHALDAFDPPVAGHRTSLQHHLTRTHSDQRDDFVDGFWLQSSSQIDGLRHRRHHEHGFYNGFTDADVDAGGAALGVHRWKQTPLVSRGVLVDVARYRACHDTEVDHPNGEALSVEELDRVLQWQQTTLRRGDALLLRTGWSAWYMNASNEVRGSVRAERRFTGVMGDRSTIAWMWDNGLSLFASDTMAGEVLPPRGGAEFGGPHEPGMIHQELIALLGLPIGELWHLETLAEDSYQTGQYACLLVTAPLHLRGGVGSPANATAIR